MIEINFIMSNFVPERVYKTFLENMPIFCIDFLINCDNEFLLLKRNEEPLKGVFWMPGGRLHKNETIENFLIRVQSREIGRFFKNYNLIGFSNYFFKYSINSRATHTPTLLFEINIKSKFTPKIDRTHAKFTWSKELPKELIDNLILLRKPQSIYLLDKFNKVI